MTERLPFHLCEFFRRHSVNGRSLALITVLQTEGSTYSKAGSQLLVNDDGDFHGMLSGGCLEGDLAESAKDVISNRRATVHTYDLRGDDDVFGLGVGCEGALQILIQPLSSENEYEPFAGLVSALDHAPHADLMLADSEQNYGATRVWAPLRVLILGAGQDAGPLIQFGTALGWEVVVSDHRPAAVSRSKNTGAATLECVPVVEVATHFDLDRFNAAIVMSHNLDADRQYLTALSESAIDFIGLLGPPHRKERLLREIGGSADKLGSRLRGPVGKPIGGRGAAAIALEIATELQAHFSTGD